MRYSGRLALCLGGLMALLLVPAARVDGQDHDKGHRPHGGGAPADDVRVLFSKRCASCHVTPDPTVATDRAFIRQLQETA
jgi:hypothetical protein